MFQHIPERDWKEFSRIKPFLLNRYCQKILDEAGGIAAGSEATAHERYLKLYEFVHREDRKIAAAFDDHRRSTALWMLAHLYSRGFMTGEELLTFSEETRKHVLELSDHAKK